MTNSTAPISYLQQLRFYLHKPTNVDIYIACLAGKRIGYLLLRHEGLTALITEAVDERYRRLGVAKQLVQYAQGIHANLTAEILSSNLASIKLHEAAGFTYAGDRGDVRTYRFVRTR